MITERRSVQHTCFPCVWDPSPPVHSSQCPGPSTNDSIVCCLFKIIPWKKNCEIEYKYKSMHNRWPKNENINTMKNSNNCTLDWMDSLDCYSCMTPTAKLATAPPRNVRENSLSRMRADHSFHHTPDTRHQRGEERMWRYDGSGLTANIASAAAGGAWVEACSACSVYTGQCPLTAGPQHLSVTILAFIL